MDRCVIPVELIDRGYRISERVIRRSWREPIREITIEVMTLLEARYREPIELDPLDKLGGASLAANIILWGLSCPKYPEGASPIWNSDPQPDCPLVTVDNSKCYAGTGECSPVILVLTNPVSGSPTSARDNVATYSPPDHVKNDTPCNKVMTTSTGYTIPRMPNGVLLKGVDCDDTSNKARYNSFSVRDDSSNSYTVAALAIGRIVSNVDFFTLFSYFNLPSSIVKSATDAFIYIYRFGFYYA